MDYNHEMGSGHEKSPSEGGSLKANKTKKVILIAALSFIILLGLMLKATTYIENADLCKRCHSMKFYYNTWVDSSHSSISCYACHFGATQVKEVKPIPVTTKQYWQINIGANSYNISGVMNTIKEAVTVMNGHVEKAAKQANFISARLQDFGKLLSFGSSAGVGKADIDTVWKNCLVCHKDLLTSKSKDNTGHRQHIQKGLTCNQCHRTVVHGSGEIMSRAECMGCHKGQLAWPASHKDPKFMQEHGKQAETRSNCNICHVKGSKEKLCMDCHGIEMPHPKDFPSLHVKSIKAIGGIKQCLKCHQNNDNKGTQKREETIICAKCHGKNLPHKRSGKTISTHGQLAVNNGVAYCISCHNKQDCASCHGDVEMPHPKGFVRLHTQTLNKVGVQQCFKCHSGQKKALCFNCHGVEMPHPEGWRAQHAGDKAVCGKCHSPANPVNSRTPVASKGFCTNCHRLKPHAVNHSQYVGQYDCYKCHDPRTCSRCHGASPL